MKSNKIIVAILGILLLCTASYIVYDKVLLADNNNNSCPEETTNTKQNKVEALEVVSDEVTNLSGMIQLADCKNISDTIFIDKKVTASDINNEQAFQMAAKKISGKKLGNDQSKIDQGIPDISSEEFAKVVKSILGKDYEYTDIVSQACVPLKYNADTKTYKFIKTACGCTSGPGDIQHIVKAIKTSNTIEIYYRVLFSYINNGTYNYYSDYARKNLILQFSSDSYGNMSSYDEYQLDLPKNVYRGGLYKQVFTLEDGNYVYTSSEPVK